MVKSSDSKLLDLAVKSHRSGDLKGAERYYTKALKEDPGLASGWGNLSGILATRNDYERAEKYCRKAISLDPKNANHLFNLGEILRLVGKGDLALEAFRASAEIDPAQPDVWRSIGAVHRMRGESDMAAEALKKAVELVPNDPATLGEYVNNELRACRWEDVDQHITRIVGAIEAGVYSDPQQIQYISASPALLRRAGEVRASMFRRKAAGLNPISGHSLSRKHGERLRIGYVSADCRNHPVAHLAVELWENHDRLKYEVFMYSTRPGDASPVRRRIEEGVEHFVDASAMDNQALAERIAGDGIHILVDAGGYTHFARTPVFALKPAPVQINFLGYPGTSGLAEMDYIIADKVVVPPEVLEHVSEAPVFMPHCYQCNDSQRPVYKGPLTRKDVGLPEDSFVMCSFNQPQKITPDVFSLWLHIMMHLPGSVLWLLEFNNSYIRTLREIAEKTGVNPKRLVSAPRMPLDKHLARYSLADIALDTAPYNGHTTTSDALFCGCPVITREGTSFQSRVSASLVRAVGLNDFIAKDLEDYGRRIVWLAQHPQILNSVRTNLKKAASLSPVFNGAQYARDMERAFEIMWKRHEAGEPHTEIDLGTPFSQTKLH